MANTDKSLKWQRAKLLAKFVILILCMAMAIIGLGSAIYLYFYSGDLDQIFTSIMIFMIGVALGNVVVISTEENYRAIRLAAVAIWMMGFMYSSYHVFYFMDLYQVMIGGVFVMIGIIIESVVPRVASKSR